ncbi:MAG: deoxyribonuclease IV [Candidatus Dormibacteraeota bacterium]|nr:deoxyribonuclease IV [Candidatus Dormibacteraeota bacterium]
MSTSSTDSPLIGGHVSTRGGIDKAVDNALRIGAEVIQTHPTPSQTWTPLRIDDIVLGRYREKYVTAGLRGHYLHAVYLINLASPRAGLLKQSVASLVHYMDLARRLDADGVVFHPGSHLGAGFDAMLPQMGAALGEVIDRSADVRAPLLIENSAGSGGCVGCGLEEVARIVEAAASDRVAVCLDTQHAFASGYDLRDAAGVTSTLDEFDRLIGFDKLALVHANDSRRELGSNVDRHTNIGDGEIGLEGFRLLLADERLRRVPWILEVPGIRQEGPDLANVNRLRECARRAALSPTVAQESAAAGHLAR